MASLDGHTSCGEEIGDVYNQVDGVMRGRLLDGEVCCTRTTK
jgi:hypothetical protein